MRSVLSILVFCLLFPALATADSFERSFEENKKLLYSLDSLLAHQDVFVKVKEERIMQLKKQYNQVKDVKELYAMNRMIYLEYWVYDADSALHYINKNGFYFTPSVRNDSLYAMKDAKSPQSSSTFQGLTNAVSLFIEIRGIGLGRTCFARRAECGFLVRTGVREWLCQFRGGSYGVWERVADI